MKKLLLFLVFILVLPMIVAADTNQIGTNYHNITYTNEINSVTHYSFIGLISQTIEQIVFSYADLESDKGFMMALCSNNANYPSCPTEEESVTGQMWLTWNEGEVTVK